MIRRVHVEVLSVGLLSLDPGSVRHVRDVLRMDQDDEVELFDDAGRTATGTISRIGLGGVYVTIETVRERVGASELLTVAAAIPKGDRADWMVEKLSELGVDRWVPLETERGVVVPGGKNKFARWERIAVEAAKQSRRVGVMRIDPMVSVTEFLATAGGGLILSTETGCRPIVSVVSTDISVLMIGPEGGLTEDELAAGRAAGMTAVGLTSTVLRVETAAVVAAGVVMCGRIVEPITAR